MHTSAELKGSPLIWVSVLVRQLRPCLQTGLLKREGAAHLLIAARVGVHA